MKYLLDTNACIGYLNGRAIGVRQRLESMPPGEVFVCSVVKAELFYGAMKSPDLARTLARQTVFLEQFDSLPFDDLAAEEYGRVRAYLEKRGEIIGPNDLLIASIALAHGVTLVTHNTDEFKRVPGLNLEDWQAG
jgi:tRNA(fMet)-specific endonuclease VapC